jgi:hypothetical protein
MLYDNRNLHINTDEHWELIGKNGEIFICYSDFNFIIDVGTH